MSNRSPAEVAPILDRLFRELMGIPFDPSLDMESVAEWDSLTHTQLLMAIEQALGIELRFEEAIRMISGSAILATLEHHAP